MLSKSRLKFIKSLQIKKYRKQERLFLVEGAKSIQELLMSGYKIRSLVLTEKFYKCYQKQVDSLENIELILATQVEVEQASTLGSNDAGIAVVEMQEFSFLEPETGNYCLMLDDIRDPGNLGTIIRIADWYGIHSIVCSEHTAEFFNPKVIASSMGSFTRLKPYYGNLENIIKQTHLPVLGAYLDGTSVHNIDFPDTGFLIMGNESNGISEELKKYITHPVTIPQFGQAESLNVAVATAVVLDNIKRVTR